MHMSILVSGTTSFQLLSPPLDRLCGSYVPLDSLGVKAEVL